MEPFFAYLFLLNICFNMKILLCGYSGKMGQLILNSFKDKYNFVHLIDSLSKYNSKIIDDVDILIDFSNPNFSYPIIIDALNNGKHVIVGTTGFTEKEIKDFEYYASTNNTGISVIYNFDKSLYLFIKALKLFDDQSNTVIIKDYHHYSKKDSPSGTSILISKAFTKSKIIFISYRVSKYVYKHEVTISGKSKLVFTHEIKDKSVYLEGIDNEIKNIMHIKGLKRTLS